VFDRRQGAMLDTRPDERVVRGQPETIAVVIPTALKRRHGGESFLTGCLESLLPAIESPGGRAPDGAPRIREVMILTQGRPFEGTVLGGLTRAGVDVRRVDVMGPFNFSRKVNVGASMATADVVLLLNDDAEMRGSEWPLVFLGVLADPGVGAVGPMILNPDGTLNASGDTHSADGVRHIDGFDARYRPGLAEILSHDHEVSLLSAAALACRLEAFRSIGCFDEGYPGSLGDSDFCLRLRASGRRLVCTSRVMVTHAESSTRDPKVPAATWRRFAVSHPEASRDDPFLPTLALPGRIRIVRCVVRPLRRAYRATIKGVVPHGLHLRLWRMAASRGWVR
jgi:O-antigen biosynthesis protein